MRIRPVEHAVNSRVQVPGSKSYTNRVLLVAALARGRSEIYGALFSDDTRRMLEGLRALGIRAETHETHNDVFVTGCGGHIPETRAEIDVGTAGTAARFLPPLVALGRGEFRIDGTPRMRERPMAPLVDSLRALGAGIEATGPRESLPIAITASGMKGGMITLDGSQSSQFLSGLLLSAPYMRNGLVVAVEGGLVSRPYIDMTCRVMHEFGVEVLRDGYRRFEVRPGRYMGHTYQVEPDASAASYFFAAAAITGGRVTVSGLGSDSLQGDLGFVHLLERMGARVQVRSRETVVTGPDRLHGIEADLADISDTVPTLAVVAAFADSPTVMTGIGFIRGKESDRIGDVARELRRVGVDVAEADDGMTITPAPIRPARIETYDDHRIAMAFALVGLRAEGIEIADPDCVAKTFPDYFDRLAAL